MLRKKTKAKNDFLYQWIEQYLIKKNYRLNEESLIIALKEKQEKNNYFLSYQEIEQIKKRITNILITKQKSLTKEREKKELERKKIKKALQKLQNQKEISINKYYPITEKTTEEQIYLLDQEINQLNNEPLFKSFHLSLLNQHKNLFQILKKERKKEKEDNTSTKNILFSLKKLRSLTLTRFYQEISKTEQILNQDEVYIKISEESKVLYRKRIQQKKISEKEIQKAIEEKKHIGYDLFPKKHPLLRIDQSNISFKDTLINISISIREKKEIDLLLSSLEKIASPHLFFNIINKNKKIEEELFDYGEKECDLLNKKYSKNYFRWNKKVQKKEKIKYIINLENIIELEIEQIKYLIGILEHPLNKPVLNKEKTKVIQGFASLSFNTSYRKNSLYLDLYQQENSKIINNEIIDFEILKEILKKNPSLQNQTLQRKYLKQKYLKDIKIGTSISQPTFQKYIKNFVYKKKKQKTKRLDYSFQEKWILLLSFKKEILYLLLFLLSTFIPTIYTLLFCFIVIILINREKTIINTFLKALNEYLHIPTYLCVFITRKENLLAFLIVIPLFLLTRNTFLLTFLLAPLFTKVMDHEKPTKEKKKQEKQSKQRKQIERNSTFSFLLYYLSHINQYPLNDSRKKLLNYNILTEEHLSKYHLSKKLPLVILDLSYHSNTQLTKEVCLFFQYCKEKNSPINLLILNAIDHKKINEIIYHIYAECQKNLKNIKGRIFYLDEKNLTKEEVVLLYTVSFLSIDARKYATLPDFLDKFKKNLKRLPTKTRQLLETVDPDLTEEITINNKIGFFNKEITEYIKTENNKRSLINTLATSHITTSLTKDNNWESYIDKKRQKIAKKEEFLINNQKIRFGKIIYGLGYITFFTKTKNIELSITQSLSNTEKMKLSKLTIKNLADKKLDFSLKYLIQIVLGENLEQEARYIVGTFSKEQNIVTLKNSLNPFYKNKICFITSSEKIVSFSLNNPLEKEIEILVHLEKNSTKEISFTLGITSHLDLQIMKEKYTNLSNIENILRINNHYLKAILKTIKVKTNHSSLDRMLNNWLPYKILNEKIFSKENKKRILDCANFINMIPQVVKQEILEYASNTENIHFLIYAIKNYIEKTEDITILETKLITKEREITLYHKIKQEIDTWQVISKENPLIQYKTLSTFIELSKQYDKKIDRTKYEQKLENIKINQKDILVPNKQKNELYNLITLLESNKTDQLYEELNKLNPLNNPNKLNLFNKYSSWIYKITLEYILGFQKKGKKLYISPHLPNTIKEYQLTYHYLNTTYEIEVSSKKNKKIVIDHNLEETDYIPLKNDYKIHQVKIEVKEK